MRKVYLHTNWHLLPWLIIHPNPILHVWSPSWPWAPDVTADDSGVSWKVHGGRSRSRSPPWLSHPRAGASPGAGRARDGSATLRHQKPRGTESQTSASGPGPGCGDLVPAGVPPGQGVPFCPAWKWGFGQGRAEPRCAAQHPPSARVLLAHRIIES